MDDLHALARNDGRDYDAEVGRLLAELEAADTLTGEGWARVSATMAHLGDVAGAAAGMVQAAYLRHVQAAPHRVLRFGGRPQRLDGEEQPREVLGCPCGGSGPAYRSRDFGRVFLSARCGTCGATTVRWTHQEAV